ncbi:MAG: c-type cytochrome [Bryobacteraceae bacterium]|jgi:hypothetical protein
MRTLLLSLLCLIPICAAPPQGGGGPKNLKLLKPEDLRAGIMRVYTVSLGVHCDFCHVQDRASDENPHKNVARHMIEITRDINSKFSDGKEHVTCFTCHRGAQEPLTAAPPAQ